MKAKKPIWDFENACFTEPPGLSIKEHLTWLAIIGVFAIIAIIMAIFK